MLFVAFDVVIRALDDTDILVPLDPWSRGVQTPPSPREDALAPIFHDPSGLAEVPPTWSVLSDGAEPLSILAIPRPEAASTAIARRFSIKATPTPQATSTAEGSARTVYNVVVLGSL